MRLFVNVGERESLDLYEGIVSDVSHYTEGDLVVHCTHQPLRESCDSNEYACFYEHCDYTVYASAFRLVDHCYKVYRLTHQSGDVESECNANKSEKN